MRELSGLWDPYVRDLLALAEIPVPAGTDERIADVCIAASLLRGVKATSVEEELHRIVSQYAMTLDLGDDTSERMPHALMILDGQAMEPTREERFAAYTLSQGIIHPNLRLGAVHVPLRSKLPDPLPPPLPRMGAIYGDEDNRETRPLDEDDELVCPATLRPFITLPDGTFQPFDFEAAYRTGLSMHRRMIDFFEAHGRFPAQSNEDKALFLRMVETRDGKRFGGAVKVMPRGVDGMYTTILRSMHVAMGKRERLGLSLDADVIRKIIREGCSRDARASMESAFYRGINP